MHHSELMLRSPVSSATIAGVWKYSYLNAKTDPLSTPASVSADPQHAVGSCSSHASQSVAKARNYACVTFMWLLGSHVAS